MTRITDGHLARHYQGVKGGRDAALLDIAQDHALHLLHQAGLFDAGLVFKGGTAVRTFRAGNPDRFSTDLDFAAPESDTVSGRPRVVVTGGRPRRGGHLGCADPCPFDAITCVYRHVIQRGRRGRCASSVIRSMRRS